MNIFSIHTDDQLYNFIKLTLKRMIEENSAHINSSYKCFQDFASIIIDAC